MSRETKIFLAVEDTEDLYENVILKGSSKLQKNGDRIVLESDGTLIEDSNVLKMLKDETLILLQPNEIWKSSKAEHSFSSCSTVSIVNSPTPPDADISVDSISEMDDGQDCEERNVNTISVNTWKSFNIPWDKMNASTLQDCEKGIREKRSISDVIHVVADAMLQIKKNIPAKAIKIIASKIIGRYPKIFEDADDDGVVLGDGSHTVFCKLKDHLKYINRPHKRSCDSPLNIPIAKRKQMVSRQAGCSNWQPAILEPAATAEESPEDLQMKLKKITSAESENLDSNVLDLLEKTYTFQRVFLNAPDSPTIATIKQEWPILLTKHGIFWHYHKLMGHKVETLCPKMLLKADKILNFGLRRKIINNISANLSDDKLHTILVIFTSYFKETFNSIYCKINDESDIEHFGITGPCIRVMNSDGMDKFCVVAEKTVICTTSELSDAIHIMFALYYTVSFAYPKSACNTLEMIQTYILKIHPDSGSKNPKKSSRHQIIGLMNKLRDF